MRKARMAATRQELRAQGPAAIARTVRGRSILRRVVMWIVSGPKRPMEMLVLLDDE